MNEITYNTIRIKRDYNKCFICGSNDLWGGKNAFCLECKGPAERVPTCLTCWGVIHSNSVNNHKNCALKRCNHKGEKDYFSICFGCYGKVPSIILAKRVIVDWNWIIEKQKELEKERKENK